MATGDESKDHRMELGNVGSFALPALPSAAACEQLMMRVGYKGITSEDALKAYVSTPKGEKALHDARCNLHSCEGCRLDARIVVAALVPGHGFHDMMLDITDKRPETEWTMQGLRGEIGNAMRAAAHHGRRTCMLLLLSDRYRPRQICHDSVADPAGYKAEVVGKGQYTHMWTLVITPRGFVTLMGYSWCYDLVHWILTPMAGGRIPYPSMTAERFPMRHASDDRVDEFWKVVPEYHARSLELMSTCPFRGVMFGDAKMESWLSNLETLLTEDTISPTFIEAYERAFCVTLPKDTRGAPATPKALYMAQHIYYEEELPAVHDTLKVLLAHAEHAIYGDA